MAQYFEQPLTEEEMKELHETLRDEKKSTQWANKVIDSWIAEKTKHSKKSFKTSKRR